MFKEWGFLISEMVVLLILAALLGLLVGWIIWGRRVEVETETVVDHAAEAKLKNALDDCRVSKAEREARIATLEGELAAERETAVAASPLIAAADAAYTTEAKDETLEAVETSSDQDFDGDGVVEGTDEGNKPTTLTAARGGQADDLKMIKGIGPKIEILCNELGLYHFDQVAAWSDQEVAWVDANLKGFKGRVSRDNWVAQAKLLATGGETEFSKRVEGGDVY